MSKTAASQIIELVVSLMFYKHMWREKNIFLIQEWQITSELHLGYLNIGAITFFGQQLISASTIAET